MERISEYAVRVTGGLAVWSINPAEHLVFNSRHIAAFRYDDEDHLVFLTKSHFAREDVPLFELAAAETLRQERERAERMKGWRFGFGWADKAGRIQT